MLTKTWQKLNLSVKDTHDRAVWRNGILGNRLTRAVARKMTLNDDDDDEPNDLRFVGKSMVKLACVTTIDELLA